MNRVLTVLFIFFSSSCFGQEAKDVCFKDVCVQAEVADTDAQRKMGLMFREYLPEDQGMLFVFEHESRHGFWMKNVSFPLDIIWIDKSGNIADIKPDLQPCGTAEICPSFFPADKALYVLEVNSGFTDKHKIRIGDKISMRAIDTVVIPEG